MFLFLFAFVFNLLATFIVSFFWITEYCLIPIIMFFMLETFLKLMDNCWSELLDNHSYKEWSSERSVWVGPVNWWLSLQVNQVNKVKCPICRRISKCQDLKIFCSGNIKVLSNSKVLFSYFVLLHRLKFYLEQAF